ncbi:Nitrilase/cyanide hydratase and apolipo protein N-acyltransferase [Meredithblackwellia eburnea MCA 4105]
MAPVKVAAIQAASVAYDLPASLRKLSSLVKQAANEGAKLAILPEAFLSAYPRHLDFKIGARTDENRQWFAKYVESSVRVPDQVEGTNWLKNNEDSSQVDEFWAFQQIAKAARDHSIYLSVGIIERSLVGSTLWCTNLLFSSAGILLTKHRKLQPTACERVVWSQGHARNVSTFNPSQSTDNLAVADTPFGKIGGLICWENLMPLPRFSLYRKGVEIWTAPTADGRPTWLPSMQHIAQEGRCYVISANQFHGPSDFPQDYPPTVALSSSEDLKKGDDIWCRGGSSIVDPLGNVLAGPLWDEEGIIYAEIDVSKLDGYRLDFDPAGHYSRDDVFSFSVRE